MSGVLHREITVTVHLTSSCPTDIGFDTNQFPGPISVVVITSTVCYFFMN